MRQWVAEWVAEWLHRHMPCRFVGRRANNALAGWAWNVAPDPQAPASVQRWWGIVKEDGARVTYLPPPRFRPRVRR